MAIACLNCNAGNGADALFCSQCGKPLPRAAGIPVDAPIQGGRRQLTALFCDIVSSTSLAKALDPEEYHDVIRGFVQSCTAAVEPFAGYVAELRGDGALIFFGYPRSHGDEPERAIRAALGIVQGIDGLATPGGAPLQVRIGIATGKAVIDESIPGKPTIVGEAVILAARLQEIADPATIVVAQNTLALAGGFFEAIDLGSREIKGFDHPVQAWRILRARTMPSRFKALHAAGQSAFVGRAREHRAIMDLWALARQGTGRVVMITGEAGIGKSRLTRRIRDSMREETFAVEYFCSPYHRTTALFPVIDRIARHNFRAEHTVDQRINALRALLASAGADYEAQLPWFAALMSLPDKGVAQSVTPTQRKHRTFEAIIWWIASHARRSPLLVILEDAQWCDPTSVELLEMLVERIGTLPMMMIVSVRTPFEARWMAHPDVVPVALDRLDGEDATALATSVAGELPPSVLDQILDKTDGIPLFIEEFTKMVLSSGRVADGGNALAGIELPATLQDSLLARLDQLAPVKHVAQCAAVIGREFGYDALSAIASIPPEVLDASLKGLEDAGLICAQGNEPPARYLFKHAMMRDAAYESLLRRERRRLHAAVAAAIEQLLPLQTRQEPELLAYHHTEAGATSQALKYWGIAALRAIQRSANLEAVAHTAKALELLDALPDTRERRLHELNLRLLSGGALWAAKGFASVEVEGTFLRAQALATEVGDAAQRVISLRGLFGCYYARGELTRAQMQGEGVKAVARQSGNSGDLTVGYMEVGSILFWRGEFEAARHELEQAIALYNAAEQRAKLLSTQIDPGANARYHLSWTLWMLGLPDQALASADRAVEAGSEIAQPLTLAMALFWRACVKLCRGDVAGAAEDTTRLRASTTEFHLTFLSATTTVLEGALLIEQGDLQGGIARLQRAVSEFEQQNAYLGRPWTMAWVAEGYRRAGLVEEGLAAVEQGFAMARLHGEAHWEAELHRVKGELLFARPGSDPREAVACVHEALAVARRLKARALELRAAATLCRMLQGGGGSQAALAGVLAAFTEGLDTRDVAQAARLAAGGCRPEAPPPGGAFPPVLPTPASLPPTP